MAKRSSLRLEVLCSLAALAGLLFLLRAYLVTGRAILPHDNFYWCYPIFHFFAEGLSRGRFPLWDPFMHGGEPFYPLWAQLRLLDPLTLLSIWGASLFTRDTVIWFNWNRFLESLAMALGAYLVFRPLARTTGVRLTLIPILLFSSFFLGAIPQDGILSSFIWVPYEAYFLLRIFYGRDLRWSNWLLLGAFIGLNWQSYHFAGTWIFLLLCLVGALLFHRRRLGALLTAPGVLPKLGLCGLVVGMMALPNLALLKERDRFVFPLRMAPADYESRPPYGGPFRVEGDPTFVTAGANMPYPFVLFTGGSSQFWDFLQMISPDGNPVTHGSDAKGWGQPSECYIYLGLLTWAVGLLGVFFGRHSLKNLVGLMTGGFALVMLGPLGGAHRLLYEFYPPLWFIRNTGLFVLFFQFGFLYFYILGMNRLFPRAGQER